jgi:hypothetical protein
MFFFQSGALFKIASVDARRDPPTYKLLDILGKKQTGIFYKEQLRKSPPPTKSSTFQIETIGNKEKIINGKRSVFCSFLFYPPKFSRWVPIENILNYKGKGFSSAKNVYKN